MKRYLMMLMKHVAHLSKRVAGADFGKAGITRSQPWILDYLDEHDGCIQRELADQSHFDPGTITSALAGMEEQGYVRRESVKGDRRALRVYLTELGREKQAYVQQVFEEMEKKSLKGFTAEEKQQLEDYLLRIRENLRGNEEI